MVVGSSLVADPGEPPPGTSLRIPHPVLWEGSQQSHGSPSPLQAPGATAPGKLQSTFAFCLLPHRAAQSIVRRFAAGLFQWGRSLPMSRLQTVVTGATDTAAFEAPFPTANCPASGAVLQLDFRAGEVFSSVSSCCRSVRLRVRLRAICPLAAYL